MEKKVPPDKLETLAQMDPQEVKDLKEKRVIEETMEDLDHQDFQASLVHLAHLGSKEDRAHWVQRDRLVPLVVREILEKKDNRESEDLKVVLDLRAHQARRETREIKVIRETRVILD